MPSEKGNQNAQKYCYQRLKQNFQHQLQQKNEFDYFHIVYYKWK